MCLTLVSLFFVVSNSEKISSGTNYEPLLDMKTMTRKMAWNIVLLCGGGMAIADGCQVGLCDFKNFLHSMFVTGSSVLQFHAIPHACN